MGARETKSPGRIFVLREAGGWGSTRAGADRAGYRSRLLQMAMALRWCSFLGELTPQE